MAAAVDLAALPAVEFVSTDVEALTSQMIAAYEQMSGKALYPAQPERVFIDWLAYQLILQRHEMNHVGRQNLLAFATGPALDHLGAMPGAARLAAQPARCMVMFTATDPAHAGIVVPARTRVQSRDRRITFATGTELRLSASTASDSVMAYAETAGGIGNGYAIGQVDRLLDAVGGIDRAASVSVSYGGTDTEDDERYRQRVRMAPETFSVAGPAGAYRWHALSVSTDILDVQVIRPEPGQVRVIVLAHDGSGGGALPSEALLEQVAVGLDAADVRPLTDTVGIVAPAVVSWDLSARVTVAEGQDAATVLSDVRAAAAAWAAERAGGLGRHLVPSQIVAALMRPGVYRVEIDSPAYRVLDPTEWAAVGAVTVELA